MISKRHHDDGGSRNPRCHKKIRTTHRFVTHREYNNDTLCRFHQEQNGISFQTIARFKNNSNIFILRKLGPRHFKRS